MGTSNDMQINAQELWAKYEDIAMHFNDLLMRLRSQSLAGIAALSTIVGVLANAKEAALNVSWLVATMIFVAMALIWSAIWCLDFLYYNRLLVGAVDALTKLELETQRGTNLSGGINMSSLIEGEFRHPVFRNGLLPFRGVLLFYGIVLTALVSGAVLGAIMHWRDLNPPSLSILT